MTDSPWVIELSTPGMAHPLRIRLDYRVVVGRGVKEDPQQPDVDLAPFGAEEQGVSRLHMAMHAQDDQLMITDLGSGNGTYLNHNRLKPNEPYRVSDGDHLQLGLLRVDLQVIVSPAYGGDVHKQPSLQLHEEVSEGHGQLVMVVQKDPVIARVLGLIFEQQGYSTRLTADVTGAIRAFNQNVPSAVVLDTVLPDMNGLEFCRYVRRNVLHNSIPIVVVDTFANPAHPSEAMHAGADIFLAKPLSAKELRYVVSSLITQREQGYDALHTKHLVGTAPLKRIKPESRRDSVVLYVAGYSDAPIVLIVQEPVSFGRAASSGNAGIKKHVDLSRYDAVNFGVSRLHMALHNVNGQFFIEDMGTVNGTYINGEPVRPGNRAQIHNADELRLGQLRMYVYFLTDSDLS
jgi:CheY-like chemotaxis protein/pSer/pThr/pTyr-binding forkhead associated (FHA) protein